MTGIVIKRLKAFAVDYMLIAAYIAVLFGTTVACSYIFSFDLGKVNPVAGQLIGFTTLTLPVILYFTFYEKSSQHGTIGKRKLGLQVVSHDATKPSFGQLLLRNCLKFLPWELAHFFLFRLMQFTRNETDPPGWVLAGLIGAQVLALIYLLSLLLDKKNRGLYELLSRTIVMRKDDA